MPPPAKPACAAATVAPALPARVRAAPADGASYLVSTLELSAGLDMQSLSLSTLPVDTLQELLRLRGCWSAAGGKLA